MGSDKALLNRSSLIIYLINAQIISKKMAVLEDDDNKKIKHTRGYQNVPLLNKYIFQLKKFRRKGKKKLCKICKKNLFMETTFIKDYTQLKLWNHNYNIIWIYTSCESFFVLLR